MSLDTLTHYRIPLLFLLAILAIPLWLWLGNWLEQDFSGWSKLAERYAAGERTLMHSQGTATVALKMPGRPEYQFRYSRGQTYIEVGIDPSGFWLRSQKSLPRPALYIPWAHVSRCAFTTISLSDTDIQISVHLQALEDACREYRKKQLQ